MTAYLLIALGTVLFGAWYDLSRSKSGRVLAFAFLFLSLFIPAAIRFELGGDCVNVYTPACDDIIDGKDVNFEPFFTWSVLFLDGVVENVPQTIFACFSFLTLLFAIVSLRRPCFTVAATAYVFLYYPFGLSGIRQALALSFMLFAMRMYEMRRYVWSVIMVALAFSSHYTILMMPVLYFASVGLARLSKKVIHVALMASVVVAGLLNPMAILSGLIGNTRYGYYLSSDKYMDGAQLGSGLGVVAMLVIAATLYFLLMSEFKDDEEEPKRLAVLCAVSVILRVSGLQCEALRRMSIIGDAFLPFAMSYICQKRPDMKNFAIVFVLMMGLFLLFVKDVSNPNPGSLELYPYKTIFGG